MNTSPIEKINNRSSLPLESAAKPADSAAALLGKPQGGAQEKQAQQTASGAPAEVTNGELSAENMKKLRVMLEDYQKSTPGVQFQVDTSSGRVMVRVVDKQTGKIVRAIPSDEVLAMQNRLEQMRGLLFHGIS